MTTLGLDIGGANIKAATIDGKAYSLPFELWKHPETLAAFLNDRILSQFDTPEQIALTMTGELCDCFANKSDGVEQIINSVLQVAPVGSLRVYLTNGEFATPEDANRRPLQVAASNWHALANLARRWIDSQATAAILIDIGSTSCDIIPLTQDTVLARGTTDTTRIANHELVYTGANRTPVCAVLNRFAFRGTSVPIAQELFATVQDAYVLLGDISQQPNNSETADGKSLTLENSKRRLARMLCADPWELDENELTDFARAIRQEQLKTIDDSLRHVLHRIDQRNCMFFTSGSGHFLTSKLVESFSDVRTCDLSSRLGKELSTAAPAFAVATLLNESNH